MNEKFILDATSGYRMMWFNKHHPNCLYIDDRPECEPDEVQDFRKLPYPDESFKLIVFDPPHIIKKDIAITSDMMRTFGVLRADTWLEDLRLGFSELWRLLKPYGILIFKWSNHQIASKEILKLVAAQPLFYQISMNRHRKGSKSGSTTVQTLWFCFMKIPEGKT